jgi:predicted permease
MILARSAGGNTEQRPSQAAVFRKVVQNPLLIACVVGLFFSLSGIRIPHTLIRTLRPLGQMALPLALFSIGASFKKGRLFTQLGPATWLAALLKVACMPLIGFILIKLFHFGTVEGRMALIFLACPTAVSSYVMAEQMGADAELAGSTVLLSTILAMPALAIVLSFA